MARSIPRLRAPRRVPPSARRAAPTADAVRPALARPPVLLLLLAIVVGVSVLAGAQGTGGQPAATPGASPAASPGATPAASPGASPVASPAVVQPGPALTAPPVVPPTDGWLRAETDHFTILVQPNGQVDAEYFSAAYAGYAETAHRELVALFGMEPPGRLTLYAYGDAAAFELVRQSVFLPPLPGAGAVADPAGRGVHLYLPSFLALTAIEADGALRNAVALNLLMLASNGHLPLGFAYGVAFYAERPPTPRLARVASFVADALARDDDLTHWFELNRPASIHANGEVAEALAYSVAAFLLERYTIGSFQDFLDAMVMQFDWRPAMEQAYGDRKAEELEQQWREHLPRWVAGEWRQNLVAAFDLEPARQLLREARYVDAKALLERSQLLYSDLGDRERTEEVQQLLLQCDTGIQAEALMVQVQQALEHHTYDRAQALLAQARAQYERLPEDHRPGDLLQTYEALAAQGLTATTSLEEAQRLGRSWADYPEARSSAVEAGTTFAHLGDEEMVASAEAVVEDLDARQRRLVLLLGALAALTGAWLALWLWARGRSELDWR